MAKTRAQRKAERRKREAQQTRQGHDAAAESRAQQRTQVPESADVIEAELAEQRADLDALRGAPGDSATAPLGGPPIGVGESVEVPEAEAPEDQALEAPAPSTADAGVPEATEDRTTRRARRAEEKERKQRSKEFEKRQRQTVEAQAERQRGPVIGFLVSCWAELKRVQWPDRETLIQASGVTLLFIAVAGAYLGLLDAAFNWLVQHVL